MTVEIVNVDNILPRLPPAADNTRGPLPVRDDDCGDIDLHVCDELSTAMDFDDYGNELDCDGPVSDDEDQD